jgi:predicted PurR-regulated permease PerM
MKTLQQFAYALIVLVLGAIVAKEGAFILVPLVWGVFFAFALYPISSWFERHRFPRGLAIFITLLVVSLMAGGIFYLLLTQIFGLIREIPEISTNVEEKMDRYGQELQLVLGEDWIGTKQQLDLGSLFTTENLNQTLFATGKSLTLVGIIPLYTFLLLYYKDFFTEFLVRYSTKDKEAMLLWVNDSGQVIQSYLVGMIRVTGIVAVLSGLFFYFIGVEFFFLFAAFIAILNLIPYVGVFISSVFAILYVFLTTDTLFYPLLTFACLWGIQLLENNLITPLVVGSKVKVNALAVILAILVGGWLWGISGMVLFIPLVGVLKISLERSTRGKAFGFLLSDDVPVNEGVENFWKIFTKKFSSQKNKK